MQYIKECAKVVRILGVNFREQKSFMIPLLVATNFKSGKLEIKIYSLSFYSETTSIQSSGKGVNAKYDILCQGGMIWKQCPNNCVENINIVFHHVNCQAMKKFSSCYKANIKVEDYFNQEMKCLKCGFCDNRMLWMFALILQMFFILVLFKNMFRQAFLLCCIGIGSVLGFWFDPWPSTMR